MDVESRWSCSWTCGSLQVKCSVEAEAKTKNQGVRDPRSQWI